MAEGIQRRLAAIVSADVVGFWYRYGYADALKDSYRLILIDARGHGASDKPHDGGAHPYAPTIPLAERPEATDPEACHDRDR